MNLIKTFGLVVAVGALAACSSPQDRAAKAQEGAYDAQQKVAQERLKLVEKYQACMKAAACDSYLKSADALK